MSLAKAKIAQTMALERTNGPAATSGVEAPLKGAAATKQPRLEPDNASLNQSQALDLALQQTEAARPEKVAEARALLNDDAYPSSAVIEQVASLLADQLGG